VRDFLILICAVSGKRVALLRRRRAVASVPRASDVWLWRQGAKFQIPSTKFQTKRAKTQTKFQNAKACGTSAFGFLGFGIYLGFGIWDLGFSAARRVQPLSFFTSAVRLSHVS
jgi:hypothetical protein